ncbi:MAG TPA: alpha/beta hydrolase fold domain-containing protein, partial [Polyangia bacterium]|nr:alpha/beta hydrolase fold domain-containing protein [Polyangia bacterium]
MPTAEMVMAEERLRKITAGARDAIVSGNDTVAAGLPPEIAAAREFYAALGREFAPDPGTRIEAVTVGGVPCELVRAEESVEERSVVLLHGGGWLAGRAAEYRQLAGRLAKVTGARVIVPDYRLAPEDKFPAALEDICAVYRGLLDEGVNPAALAIGGSSAGSALSLAALVVTRGEGRPMPAAVYNISPAVDLTASSPSLNDPSHPDFIAPEVLRHVYKNYLGDHDPADPLASPVFADLTGLPPLHVEVGGAERLVDDATLLVERARSCGVTATL